VAPLRRSGRLFALPFLLALLVPQVAHATTYYVDPVSGNNNYSGDSQAAPWQTLNRASQATFQPGDTLKLSANGALQRQSHAGVLTIDESGTEQNPITITRYGSWPDAMIDGQPTPEVPKTDCVVLENTASYIKLENVATQKCSSVGIDVSGDQNTLQPVGAYTNEIGLRLRDAANDNLVKDSSFTDNNILPPGVSCGTTYGILIHGDGNTVDRVSVGGTTVATCNTGVGLGIVGGQGNTVRNSRFVGNDTAIEVSGTSPGNKVDHNKVQDSQFPPTALLNARGFSTSGTAQGTIFAHNSVKLTGSNSVGVSCQGGCSQTALHMKNNIVEAQSKAASADAGFDEDYNLFWGSAPDFTRGQNSRFANPEWVLNQGGFDELEVASYSPAIDLGTSLGYAKDYGGLFAAVDGDGDGLQEPDAGALEYQAVPQPHATVQKVPTATAYRYKVVDDTGGGMDGLKIIDNPTPGAKYLGVYHNNCASVCQVKVASSNDLLTWTFQRTLDPSGGATYPTIKAMSDGIVVAYEEHSGCTGGAAGQHCLRFLRYANSTDLLNGSSIGNVTAPISPMLGDCSDGTPSIEEDSTSSNSIHVRFHYQLDGDTSGGCSPGREQQAEGTFSFSSSWQLGSPTANTGFDQRVRATRNVPGGTTIGGGIADRDSFTWTNGKTYSVIEASFNQTDPASWRTYLDDGTRTYYMNTRTLAGSAAVRNPTVSRVKNPNGAGNVTVMTLLVLPQGVQPSVGTSPQTNAQEDGTLIYYYDGTTHDPIIAAAGDIATSECVDDICFARDTSNLLVDAGRTPNKGFDWVLNLGDNEYNASATAPYFLNYERTWGRVQTITKPTPGNHDPCSGATQATQPFRRYDDYFGVAFAPQEPCYYAYDIGNWHIISLDSSNPGGTLGSACGGPASDDCKEGSAQDDFLENELQSQPDSKCVLVYWHHPRWDASGLQAGEDEMQPIWDTFFLDVSTPKRPDIVLNGHLHNYQRFKPLNRLGETATPAIEGITEFIVGTGGHETLHSVNTPASDSRLDASRGPPSNNDAWGILKLTLRQSKFDFDFDPINGAWNDSGTGPNCHA
jgi:hypothetical protein